MPPVKEFQPFDDLMWQPVPLETIPREHDTLIIQRRDCARYDIEMERELQSEFVRELDRNNSQLYEFITSKTGVNVTGFRQIDSLHNSLNAMELAGWKLPEWTSGIYPSKTSGITLRYLKFLSETKFMKMARGGSLLTEISKSMLHLNESVKVSIYSGHDVTLVNLISVLNLADQLQEEPKYAATLAVELVRDQIDDDMNVRILYFSNEHDENPREFALPNCANQCKLSQFIEKSEEYFVFDYDKMCHVG